MIIVQVAGRLGKDAESRFTPSGLKVTTLTLATNVRKGGKEETVWWRVTIWGERYDKMMPYLKKGSAIIAIGEMNKPDIWVDKEGKSQISLELTADILRFSPFGNPERTQESTANNSFNQGQGAQTTQKYQTPAQGIQGQTGFESGTDFGDFTSGANYSSFGASSQYGSDNAFAQNNDPLPF